MGLRTTSAGMGLRPLPTHPQGWASTPAGKAPVNGATANRLLLGPLLRLAALQRIRQPWHAIGPVGHRDRRACKRLADRLVPPAEVTRQKRLHHRVERQAVLRPGEAVALIG